MRAHTWIELLPSTLSPSHDGGSLVLMMMSFKLIFWLDEKQTDILKIGGEKFVELGGYKIVKKSISYQDP